MRLVVVLACLWSMAGGGFAVAATTDLVDGDFEWGFGHQATGRPNHFGIWTGDLTAIVPAKLGIKPYNGVKMLQVLSTSVESQPTTLAGNELYQLVPVPKGAAGYGAYLRARFNRVSGGAMTDDLCQLALYGFAADPSKFARLLDQRAWRGRETATLRLDGNEETWEMLEVRMNVLADMTFFAVSVNCSENVFNDRQSLEFDGHFVDGVELVIGD